MALIFELEKNGFPITIGKHEFFFDTSLEGLVDFYEREKTNRELMKKIREEAENVGDISELISDDSKDVEKAKEKVVEAMAVTEKLLRLKYDYILGDGAFDNIYGTFKDMDRLEEIFDSIESAVNDAILENASKRADNYEQKHNEILKKKALKKKKAKK